MQTHFFSHGIFFELPDSLCIFPPGTKDPLVLEAMSNDSCLLDLKGVLSAGRKPGSSETQGSLVTSAPSAFHEEFGERVSDGVLEGQLQPPSRFTFLPPPTSNHPLFKSLSTHTVPGSWEGGRREAPPSAPRNFVPFPLMLQPKPYRPLSTKVLLATNEAMTINSCRPYSEQLVFQTWN